MRKILLVIQREYLTRVQKKSFWIASLLAPILMTTIYIIPIWLASKDKDIKRIEVLDKSGIFDQSDLKHKDVTFTLVKGDELSLKKEFRKKGYAALAVIQANILDKPGDLKIYSEKNISFSLKSDIERVIQTKVRQMLLTRAGISAKIYEETQVQISGDTFTVSEGGKELDSSSGGAMILAGVLGFLLYITLLLYGSQVMNGVIEEKSSRIIEVIISSIKPYQLMLGKILGVGMVGLTQFLLWIILTVGLTTVTSKIYSPSNLSNQTLKSANFKNESLNKSIESSKGTDIAVINEVFKVVESTNIPLIVGSFFFYFFFGYLLYSSLFAAIGSAVESAAEAQQFTFPVMIPIIVAFLLAQFTMQDPDSQIAFWASIIPFTSPINMMVRLPYGVPTWELILSMLMLVLGFLGCAWISARIYRVGILMYGKKMTWKEISKWVFYKG